MYSRKRVIAAALLPLAAGAALALSTRHESQAEAQTARAIAQRLVRPYRAQLAKSGIPVLVFGEAPAAQLAVDGTRVHPGSYGIDFALAPECHGATACYFGAIEGHRGGGAALRGRRVHIALGATAFITDGACGASCGPSTLAFDYRGSRYEIDAKATDAELASYANGLVTLETLYR